MALLIFVALLVFSLSGSLVFAFTPTTRDELYDAVFEWTHNRANASEVYGEINTWNTSLITDMSSVCAVRDFNSDISNCNWDLSNVVDMSSMFSGAFFLTKILIAGTHQK